MKAMVGDYPATKLFKQKAPFEFADVKVPNTAFKRVVRNLEFDLAELAIMTFLLAKMHGKPLRLLPAVVTSRFQHPLLVYNTERTPALTPKGLEGKRVGLRSYSVTTATWIRGILADQYGVDLSKIRWITFEDPHVAEFRDPPNVEKQDPSKNVTQMLLDGEIEAAILAAPPADPRLKPLFPDPDAAAAEWKKKFGVIQINHMLVVKESMPVSESTTYFELMKESIQAGGKPGVNPCGIEENRRNLEVAIDCIWRQKMLPRRPTVEELFK